MTISNKLPSSGSATVKQVISGDSIVLRGRAVNGPPPERTIYLNYVNAPRLGSAKEPEKEEQGAFEAREFLRTLLVGKIVSFQVDYTTNNSRDYGSLKLQSDVDGEIDVASLLVKNGMVKVKSADGRHAPSEEHVKLLDLEKQAASNGLGLFAQQQKKVRKVITNFDNAQEFLKKYRGKTLKAVLEQVRDGSTLRPLVLLETDKQQDIHQLINFQISGVKAPTFRKDIPGVEDMVEPHGEEAKFFVESRLLQRDIDLIIEGASNNFMIGSVIFPAGNIAEVLLSEGLAKVSEWSLSMVTGGSEKLRAAEAKAKARQVRLWKSYVAPAVTSSKDFNAIVTRIITPDTILVENIVSGVEKKVSFSSLKVPKMKESNESFYHQEAKEFVRSKLIGKKVHVHIEFVKPAQDGYEEKECATVKLGSQNIAESLVSQGLASVIRHKATDMNRSSCYDALLIAEDKAKADEKGLHSNSEPPILRIADVSENASKAKQYLPFLQRAGGMSGVVEHCFNGGRFKIFVPSQNCRLTFVFSGLRVPKNGRNPSDKSEPFANEALQFVQRHVLQRNVQIVVEDVDRVGSFIGQLFVESDASVTTGSNKNLSAIARKSAQHNGENIAIQLATKGFATVHEPSALRSSFGRDLIEAEKIAKTGRVGIWSLIDPNALEEDSRDKQQGVDFSENIPHDSKKVVVSNISEGIVSVQVLSQDLDKLEKMMADFSLHHQGKSAPTVSLSLRAGDYISAQFTQDDQWYRAQVKKVNADKTYQVLYIDYGNQEIIGESRIRPLDAPFKTSNLSPQSFNVELSFIRVIGLDEDCGLEAFEYLRDLTEGKTLIMKQAHSKGQALSSSVLLYTDNGVLINESLVSQGYAVVQRTLMKEHELLERSKSAVDRLLGQKNGVKTIGDIIGALIKAQDEAKSKRLNIWRYGDIVMEDEEF